MTHVLTCAQLVERVTDYLEEASAPEEVVAVAAHLSRCTGCTRYVEQIRLTVVSLGGLGPVR